MRSCALATRREQPRTVFFLTASTADYCDIVNDPAKRGDVLRALFDEMRHFGVEEVILANVPSDSAALRELSRIEKPHGFHSHSRPAYDCGLILFGNSEERQAVLQTVRKMDKEKRGLKKMAQMGAVHLTHLKAEQAEEEMAPIYSAQISRFLATRRVSPLVLPVAIRAQAVEKLRRRKQVES